MKFIISLLLVFSVGTLFGQTVINFTDDEVRTETLVISENTIINGNNNAFRCDGCDPAISVVNGAKLQLNDVKFPRVFTSWIQVADGAEARWDSRRMTGYLISNHN